MTVSKRRILGGAAGGALGSVAMKAVVRFCDPHSFGLSSQTDAKAARLVFGEHLDGKRARQIGAAVHYGLGIATGAAYAAITEKFPGVGAGRGAAFGLGLWLIGDELAISAAGLESAGAADAFSHASALAAHLVYVLIVDACSSTALSPGSRSEHAAGCSELPRTR